ncbi:arylsulfatase A-like [Antedon mediterranea]|uniref:arylsulfatase A-like n=1 Tax=Antedon mediterranea TaxID=105859 RepID=UPI003AF46A35
MRCGKYSTFDGGSRVPAIASWPGHIKQGVSMVLLSHLDIWPTLRRLSGTPVDYFDIILDGYDISDVMFSGEKSPRKTQLYYNAKPSPDLGPFAIRNKRYKGHFMTTNIYSLDRQDFDPMCLAGNSTIEIYTIPFVYDLLVDPEERFDIANQSQCVVQMMLELMEESSNKVTFGQSVLLSTNNSVLLCCNSGCAPFPSCCQCNSLYNVDLFPLHLDCSIV